MFDMKRHAAKITVLIVVIVVADIIGLWVYLRHSASPAESSSGLVPPDVTQGLPPSPSEMGVFSKAAVVATGLPCAAIGRQMLDRGGSAVDAAIATLLCDGVCVMQSMGVGGGFIMTIYNRTEKKTFSLVARETAPAAAARDMYVKNSTLSTFGALSAGIPGELKGYQEAHKRFGRLPWRELFQPTIQLCREGVPINKRLETLFQDEGDLIRASPSAVAILLNSTGGRLPKEGDFLKLPLLANTLSVIADSPNMAEELYNGSLTRQFVTDIQQNGGIITEEDMNNYKVVWEEPYKASLSDGLTVYSAALPGSGILVTFILRLLDGLFQFANSDTERSQLIIEAFKHAYGRRTDLGDPHYVNATLLNEALKDLTEQEFIMAIREKINNNRTSNNVSDYGADYEGEDHGTDHIAVMDPEGCAVSVTSTVNLLFGSKFVSKSTGILLNNEMDDFSTPGTVNSFGVSPSEANYIQPGKMPMSSMTPTIVVDHRGDVRLVIGGSGGTRITTQTTLATIRIIWLGKNIKEAIDAARFHHQLLPMSVKYEYGILQDMVDAWHRMGHSTERVSMDDSLAAVNGIARVGPNLTANSDWRRPGSIAGF